MTRTPDEIKKRLANNIPVHYHPGDNEPRLTPLMMVDLEELHADALALIQQLEAELEDMTARYKIADDCAKKKGEMNEKLYAELADVKAERDAAVRDCGCFPCQTCEERENGDLCPMCEIQGGFRKFHQWRGVQKEN